MSLLEFVESYWPRLLAGTWVTVLTFLFSAALGLALATCAGLSKLSKNLIIRSTAIAYIELFRGTSLLVQLYWIFFVLPLFGMTIDKFPAGIIAIGLNIGAYGAEIVRGAVSSVAKGQWEAALALNMSSRQRMRRIILPQAFLIALPAWGNIMIELLKATALVSLISTADIMYEAKQINGQTFMSAQVFGIALIIYYILARFILTPSMRMLERRLRNKLSRV